MRKLVGIQDAGPYLNHRSPTTTYRLVRTDPAFAALWFKSATGATQTFEDRLITYVEGRAASAPAFPQHTSPQPKRPVGRPRKHPRSEDQVAAPGDQVAAE